MQGASKRQKEDIAIRPRVAARRKHFLRQTAAVPLYYSNALLARYAQFTLHL